MLEDQRIKKAFSKEKAFNFIKIVYQNIKRKPNCNDHVLVVERLLTNVLSTKIGLEPVGAPLGV